MGDDRRVHTESECGVEREGQFLLDDRLVSEVPAPATEFLGQVEAEKPGVAGFGPELAVDLVLVGPSLLVRCGFSAEELGSVLPEQGLVVGLPRCAVVGEQFTHGRTYFPVKSGARLARNAAWPS